MHRSVRDPINLTRRTDMTPDELLAIAAPLAVPFKPGADCESGTVAAAILAASGAVYTGICVDTPCGMGFCAEHSAVAEMLKARESEISMVVAVNHKGRVFSPCGRCRELMWQVDARNADAIVVLPAGRTATLRELLPDPTR
jgi:cytidine deaminase